MIINIKISDSQVVDDIDGKEVLDMIRNEKKLLEAFIFNDSNKVNKTTMKFIMNK